MSGERRAWVELDLDAVRDNVRAIRGVAGVDLLAVVKADAYGHGAAAVGRAALEAGARALGVATAGEAVALRDAGLFAPIQVLGSFLEDEVDDLIAARAELTLHEADDLQRASDAARRAGRPVRVHLKVDVGMHRHGVDPELALPLLARAATDPALRVEGLMTHLPSPGDAATTAAQMARFTAIVAAATEAGLCPPRVHAAASAALFLCPATRMNGVRAGLALLGLDPDDRVLRTGTRLAPALSLRARVMRTRVVPAGDPVGYGGRFTTTRETRLALLGIGYADGVPYGLGGQGGEVLLQGQRCPLVGTVMMDYVAADVTDLPRAPAPGDVATIVGQDGAGQVLLVEHAKKAGLIPYALSCGLGQRLGRAGRGAREPSREAPLTLSASLRRAA